MYHHRRISSRRASNLAFWGTLLAWAVLLAAPHPTLAAGNSTVNKADTTTTITSDAPDPSIEGQSFLVQYNVTVNSPGSGIPSGNVTISDGTDSCTATIVSGQCSLTLTTAGARTLTATYPGDANFNSSTSANEAHTVISPATTTAITSDIPDPSVVGQAVTVQYSVTPNASSGTPSGNVTVSDGMVSCIGTVAAGTCSITFTSAGAKTLTATYTGDVNFNGSSSAAVAHTVNKADTTTMITSDAPDPSIEGQSFLVQYNVTVNSPGSGIPSGNVTISDGIDSCTATLASGQCRITLTSAGARILTATYLGDANYNTSTSANEPHTVTILNPTPPNVTINQASGQNDPTSASPIHFTAVFNEPVTGFTNTDVTLSGTAGATTAVITEIAPNDGTTYDVAVSGMTTNGVVTASIPNNVATNAAGNGNTASTSTDNSVAFILNNLPVANADSAVVNEDSAVDINVLTNDFQPANTTIFVSGITQPAHGSNINRGDGIVGYVPTPNYFGPDSFAYTILDDRGGTSTANVSIIVRPVNDAPSFTKGPDVTVAANSGLNSIANWATALSFGPANESGQALNFLVANNNNTLFAVQPDVTANGTLTFTPAPNASGSATITVALHDDGGTTNGGVDTSAVQTFTITITPPQTIYLTIAKSHSGNFTQGQIGAQYTITASNIGTAPSSGTVTVVDNLPTGLTATAISGTGWNCTLSTLTCTRPDALAAGGSYPNILVTVNVASNAPTILTNTATVSGGGDQSTNDNTASDPTTVTAITKSAQLVADPCFSGMNALLVSGTSGDDTITLRSASRGKITVIINSANLGTFKPTGLIIVLGQAGNDTITVDDAIIQPRMLYGNDGNDTIKDGIGLGIIVGGAGDDTLISPTNRDILIGGTGADQLTGSLFGDILIAGSTSYDEPTTANQSALCSIYAEWSNLPRGYQTRINHLTGASRGGLNGTNWLKPGQTVFDDSSKDTLIGSPGQDWFLLNTTGAGILDASDRNRWEIATDL